MFHRSLARLVSERQSDFTLREQLLFLLIADALTYPEVVPQLKFDVAYRWYLLREYDAAMAYFEVAHEHKDQLAEFAKQNTDRLVRACQAERDKQKALVP